MLQPPISLFVVRLKMAILDEAVLGRQLFGAIRVHIFPMKWGVPAQKWNSPRILCFSSHNPSVAYQNGYSEETHNLYAMIGPDPRFWFISL